MRIRLIAALLTLASVFGIFGCSAVPAGDMAEVLEDSALLSGSGLLNTGNGEESAEDLINVAALDEDGQPLFQIVYNISAGLRVQDQCETLAADIYDATGVTLPVVHSMAPQKTYEITVGDIARRETIDVIDGFDLGDNDFTICVVGTRVLIYAETDHALVSAVIYFMDELVQRSELQGIYAVKNDLEITYRPSGTPTVTVQESEDSRYVNITLQDGVFATYVRLSYTGNKGWRIQTKYRETEAFRDDGAAQVLAYSLGEYKLGTEDARFYTEEIQSSKVGDVLSVSSKDGSRVEISLNSADFGLRFYTADGDLSAEITSITCNAGGSTITGTLNDGEAIFGTGERFNAANQRGKKIEMFTKDIWSKDNACYMVIPLLSFSRGAGVFLNNYEHMMLDLDSKKQNVWSASITGAPLDCYVFTTTEIEEVIHNYSRLSGYANMPEEWTYGMLVCGYAQDFSGRWTEESSGEGIYDAIAKMEAYDLPWTGILAEPWAGYKYSANHKELKELCDYVHSLGKKFLVYMRIGFASGSMVINGAISGFDSSYLVTQTRADGTKSYNLPDTTRDTNNPDAGTSGAKTHVYLDITNPDATEWFFEEYWDYLTNDIGVDGCKIDFCETMPENYELNYFDENIPTAGSHHWYPSAFCAMFYDMLAKKPDGGMCYTRGGGIGAQRAPYMWAGDQVRSWNGIQWQLTGTLTSGLSGVPFMSYDMAGYRYDYTDPTADEIANEAPIFVRGTQYSAFTICIQTHGNVRRSYVFADYEDEDGGHPYAYATELYRAYTKLHEHLTPYITELSEEATTTGMPVVRHLILGWQNDTNVYTIEDEFTLGDAFLIAPVFSDSTTRSVYLPEGKWEDLNTGTVYEVGAEGLRIDVTASIAELPSFFNMETESETARELVDGIKALYDYARSLAPEA